MWVTEGQDKVRAKTEHSSISKDNKHGFYKKPIEHVPKGIPYLQMSSGTKKSVHVPTHLEKQHNLNPSWSS